MLAFEQLSKQEQDFKVDSTKFRSFPNDSIVEETIKALKSKNHQVFFVDEIEQANELVQSFIPESSNVYSSLSVTLDEIGFQKYSYGETCKWNYLNKEINKETNLGKQLSLRKKALSSDYFVSSVCAITKDGEIFDADSTGTRVGGYTSAQNVIIVVGVNKIVENSDDALQRIKEFSLPSESVRARFAFKTKGSYIQNIDISNNDIPISDFQKKPTTISSKFGQMRLLSSENKNLLPHNRTLVSKSSNSFGSNSSSSFSSHSSISNSIIGNGHKKQSSKQTTRFSALGITTTPTSSLAAPLKSLSSTKTVNFYLNYSNSDTDSDLEDPLKHLNDDITSSGESTTNNNNNNLLNIKKNINNNNTILHNNNINSNSNGTSNVNGKIISGISSSTTTTPTTNIFKNIVPSSSTTKPPSISTNFKNHHDNDQQANNKRKFNSVDYGSSAIINPPDKFIKQGIASKGLKNLGNTCYMNAILQSIFGIKCLIDDITHKEIKKYVQDGLYEAAMRIYTLLMSDEQTKTHLTPYYFSYSRSVDPTPIKLAIDRINPFFKGYSQHDAHEFFVSFLDILEEDFKNKVKRENESILKMIEEDPELAPILFPIDIPQYTFNYCPITKNFKSKINLVFTCCKCKQVSTSTEIFTDFSIEIPKIENIKNEENELEKEKDETDEKEKNDKVINESNQNFNNSNNNNNLNNDIQSTNTNSNNIVNSTEKENINENNVDSNNIKKEKNTKLNSKTMTYSINSIVRHYGTVYAGHYVCYMKSCKNSKNNNSSNWILLDDSTVKEVSNDDVLKSNGYLFFYLLNTVDVDGDVEFENGKIDQVENNHPQAIISSTTTTSTSNSTIPSQLKV
eukprot:gene452-572_t